MLNFDPKDHGGHYRPDFLIPKDKLEIMLNKVLDSAPTSLSVIWGSRIYATHEELESHY